jgi:hypothetical protein
LLRSCLERQFTASLPNQSERQSPASNAIRGIEGRGFGKDAIERIGNDIAGRLGQNGLWHTFLDRAADSTQNELIADAVGEWADQDAIAAHIGYGLDYFCTADTGRSATHLGASIFTQANRAWLTSTYGIRFITLDDLAATLGP